MKRFQCLAIAALAAFLSGCAGNAYIEAQKLAIQADGNVRVAQAQESAARWNAVAIASAKLDASGAAAVASGAQWSEAMGRVARGQERPLTIERPRDALDYIEGFTRLIGVGGNVAVAFANIRENGKTQRASYDRDVRLEEQRQTGETLRATAPRAPTYALQADGDINFGSGTIDRSDRRNCSSSAGDGGAGAAAGAPINLGNVAGGAGPISLSSLISAAAAGGGRGGRAMGNC